MRLLLLALVIMATSAFADSGDEVDMVIGGRSYVCTPRDAGGGGTGVVDCVNHAYSAGPYTRDESMQLCQGARSTGPADCGIKAYLGPFSRGESISLCTRAMSVGPADCAIKAYSGPFQRGEALSLCSSPWADVGTADCALKAYAGPYSREEAIRMCRPSHERFQGLMGNVVSPQLLSKNESERLIILVNEKAMAEGTYKK